MLVLRPGALGDALLAVPALRALRLTFGRVTFASQPGASRLLASIGEVDGALSFDDPTIGRALAAESWDEPVVAWMAEAPSYALIRAPSRPPELNMHVARYLLETLGLGSTFDAATTTLAIRPFVSDEVLVHPGSGSRAKNWPARCFAATIRALDAPVRLIVGDADLDVATALEAHLGRPLPRLEHVPLEDLASRLAGCRAYLGNDSGVSHLAGLCTARTVALFGPTDPTVWRPLGPNVHVASFDADPQQIAALLRAI